MKHALTACVIFSILLSLGSVFYAVKAVKQQNEKFALNQKRNLILIKENDPLNFAIGKVIIFEIDKKEAFQCKTFEKPLCDIDGCYVNCFNEITKQSSLIFTNQPFIVKEN